MEPVLEHLVIFSMDIVQSVAVATLLMAFTSVVHSPHRVLYPFFQMPMAPELSTQTLRGFPRQFAKSAATQMIGPTSSRAESFLHSRRPSALRAPELILRPQGTRNQNLPPMPPVPCPGDSSDPPDSSVKYSSVQAGSLAADGMEAKPVVVLSMTHQKYACLLMSAVISTVAFLSVDADPALISSTMLNFPPGIRGV
jgi:hypothetical protein